MVDICYLCAAENISSPSAAFKKPIAAILSKDAAALVHRVEPHSKVLDALDAILEGSHILLVPIRSTAGYRKKLRNSNRHLLSPSSIATVFPMLFPARSFNLRTMPWAVMGLLVQQISAMEHPRGECSIASPMVPLQHTDRTMEEGQANGLSAMDSNSRRLDGEGEAIVLECKSNVCCNVNEEQNSHDANLIGQAHDVMNDVMNDVDSHVIIKKKKYKVI